MAGIYIHIPFCRKACHYCNFHFSTSQHLLPDITGCIIQEAGMRQSYLEGDVETIYLGGGTPSLLPPDAISAILSSLKELFRVSEVAEITLEANPDDITEDRLGAWKDCGINRLSIGVQSFFEEDLEWMNRAHNARQARECITLAHKQGFQNLTIDLIYGTPGLTDENWKQNLATAIALGMSHISCYALTVEPQTVLARKVGKGEAADVDPEKQARHFSILMEMMTAAGFEQYEISNFAMRGHRSRHNSSYWQGKHYLGLGPSAHSFNGTSRQWNIANNALYLNSIKAGVVPFEMEILSGTQQLNEYLMTGLRTMEGCSREWIEFNWGSGKWNAVFHAAQKHIDRGHLLHVNGTLQLSKEGKFLADGIASDLFTD